MSNYCSVSEIEIFLYGGNLTFSASTKPTLVQVTDIIDQVTNEIDLVLEVIHITNQPTSAKILAYLKKICIWGTAGRIGNTNNSTTTSYAKDTRIGYYLEKYEAELEKIASGNSFLGAVTDTDSLLVSNNVLDGTYTEEDINSLSQENNPRW